MDQANRWMLTLSVTTNLALAMMIMTGMRVTPADVIEEVRNQSFEIRANTTAITEEISKINHDLNVRGAWIMAADTKMGGSLLEAKDQYEFDEWKKDLTSRLGVDHGVVNQ